LKSSNTLFFKRYSPQIEESRKKKLFFKEWKKKKKTSSSKDTELDKTNKLFARNPQKNSSHKTTLVAKSPKLDKVFLKKKYKIPKKLFS
jgi:hypothetical protein